MQMIMQQFNRRRKGCISGWLQSIRLLTFKQQLVTEGREREEAKKREREREIRQDERDGSPSSVTLDHDVSRAPRSRSYAYEATNSLLRIAHLIIDNSSRVHQELATNTTTVLRHSWL